MVGRNSLGAAQPRQNEIARGKKHNARKLQHKELDTHAEELLQHASPHTLHAGHQPRIEPHERYRKGEEIDDQRSSRVEHTDSEEVKSPTPLRQGHTSERQRMARCHQGVADGRQLKSEVHITYKLEHERQASQPHRHLHDQT